MKSFLPVLSLVLVFASCSTAYKAGQTPDDVYFSPERAGDEYVRVQKDDDRRYRGQDYYSYEDDRYLRMRVRDRSRWSYLDDYYRDPYAYNYNPYYSPYRDYNNYYYGYWNPRQYWNYYYNPYAPTVIVTNPRTPVYNKPRTYNLHVFDTPKDNENPKYRTSTRSRDYYNPGDQRNSSRDAGNNLRRSLGTSEGSSYSKPSSSSSSNSSSSSSSNSGSNSSGSGGKAPVRRF
jgi:hypothetical protein